MCVYIITTTYVPTYLHTYLPAYIPMYNMYEFIYYTNISI